jgi:hypothetical protein
MRLSPDCSVEDKPDENEQQTQGGQRRHRIEHGSSPSIAIVSARRLTRSECSSTQQLRRAGYALGPSDGAVI